MLKPKEDLMHTNFRKVFKYHCFYGLKMKKKCLICNAEAEYRIKDTSDYYCADCAEENFADLSLLLKVEEEAKKLKVFVDEKIGEEDVSED